MAGSARVGMALSIASRVRLNDGHEMPRLGLGVWQAARGPETRAAVAAALRTGYRLIDTAKLYGNETEVGEAVRTSVLAREEVFVTTKLWNDDHGRVRAPRAFAASLERLGLGYVDLYLIHWPGTGERLATWEALTELAAAGTARSIGVSNFTVAHLEELLARSGVVPAVDQVELHPHRFPRELLDFCRRHRIQLEAYSPLGRGAALGDPTVAAIARDHGRTAAQVALRWELQHDLVTIPKSVHPDRIRENAAVFDFELTPEEMGRIDALGGGSRPPEVPDGAR
jgi:methylglyoxal/glyoxal reductase